MWDGKSTHQAAIAHLIISFVFRGRFAEIRRHPQPEGRFAGYRLVSIAVTDSCMCGRAATELMHIHRLARKACERTETTSCAQHPELLVELTNIQLYAEDVDAWIDTSSHRHCGTHQHQLQSLPQQQHGACCLASTGRACRGDIDPRSCRPALRWVRRLQRRRAAHLRHANRALRKVRSGRRPQPRSCVLLQSAS